MKRRAATGLVTLAILAAFVVWLDPTRVLWGWLRGEAFYQGRPTSYWSREIATWHYYPLGTAFVRTPTRIEQWLARLQVQPSRTVVMPIPFPFDREAVPVLRELVTDPNPNARRNAQLALDSLVVR